MVAVRCLLFVVVLLGVCCLLLFLNCWLVLSVRLMLIGVVDCWCLLCVKLSVRCVWFVVVCLVCVGVCCLLFVGCCC